MSRCFIYARTSSRHQHELGIKSQIDSATEYAERNGYKVVGTFKDEHISGTTPLHKRPALFALIQGLERDDIVIAHDRSRLGRDALVVLTIEAEIYKAKAKIETADGTTAGDTPEQVLIKRMMDCINEFQVQILRQKTSAALQRLKKEGRSTGNPPYGYGVGPDGTHLIEIESEQNILKRVSTMRADGHTWQSVVNCLNLDSLTRSGRRWTLHGCYKVFKGRIDAAA
jgi:site-specific DNA recombinase